MVSSPTVSQHPRRMGGVRRQTVLRGWEERDKEDRCCFDGARRKVRKWNGGGGTPYRSPTRVPPVKMPSSEPVDKVSSLGSGTPFGLHWYLRPVGNCRDSREGRARPGRTVPPSAAVGLTFYLNSHRRTGRGRCGRVVGPRYSQQPLLGVQP